ncbi:MAG: hypothetical protein WCD38_02465 [Candidatus Tumulicola sp.]
MNDSSQQSGFTLAETVVTLGLLALFAGGVVWMLGSHPGSLARAAADFDAALTSARAIAATSGNGATVVFLPRGNPSHALAGFTLRVFSGRPTAASEVRADTVMPVTSDAGVSETTLGSPPFSLFFGASGDVSGASRYPQTDAHGDVRFPAIAIEPPCPRAGFVLSFVSAQHTVTRRLPCASPVAATAAPNPSPTPNVPLITPAQLQYRWPADARQTFVATEWGYTHWFAADGFACGSGVAEFPNVLPSPYSPPYDAHEGDATPPPPPHAPYSYPNSGGQSMNDAPAPFPLDPVREGLCTATVVDAWGQPARVAVDVMGWLTASYGGNAYTHRSRRTLSLPATTFPNKGATVTIALSKSYDAQPLQGLVEFDGACSPYLSFASLPGKTPPSPAPAPATAAVTLTLVTQPAAKTRCGGVLYDQYAGALGGEGIPFNATLGAQRCANERNVWQGPADGACYDLYFVVTGTTQTGGWTEESVMGVYAPHGTPGMSIYSWIVDDGVCSVRNSGGVGFAQWGVLLGNGDPTPPPVATPQPMRNQAGFGVTFASDTVAVTSAPDPNPTRPPPLQCGSGGIPTPSPPP